VKSKLFGACAESTLLYFGVAWTLTTDTLSRKQDGCHTKLLRYALNFKCSDYDANNISTLSTLQEWYRDEFKLLLKHVKKEAREALASTSATPHHIPPPKEIDHKST
jgi:hypothetical protein